MVIALVMRAVRGGGAGGLGSSGAGQDGTRSPMLTLQMLPRDYKIYPSAWEEMQPYLDIFLRALACWSVILGSSTLDDMHQVATIRRPQAHRRDGTAHRYR